MKNEILPMFIIMFISGLLSTMNLYVDNLDDIRWSINDVYMSLMMCGWMFLFWGIFYKIINQVIIGILILIISFCSIRTQFLVTPKQYLRGMIPHHSMAVKMSKKLIQNKKISKELTNIANNIISTQKEEIKQMKNIEK